MKAFLDTSVLIATFYGDHEHHGSSLDLFLRFGKSDASCAVHSLAEVYATLTRMPGKHRVRGDENADTHFSPRQRPPSDALLERRGLVDSLYSPPPGTRRVLGGGREGVHRERAGLDGGSI